MLQKISIYRRQRCIWYSFVHLLRFLILLILY